MSVATVMHPGMGGAHNFRITIRTNDPIVPEAVLTLKGYFGPQ